MSLTKDETMTDSALDRRLTNRVLNVWKRLAGNGIPRRSQIDPADFGGDWANCLLIDLDPVLANSRFSYVGNALRDPTWPTFERQTVSECLEGTLLELLVRHLPKVAEKRKPMSVGGSAFHEDTDILYRAIILPLSESGQVIDGIMAAILYREVAVSEPNSVADEVLRPILARASSFSSRRSSLDR